MKEFELHSFLNVNVSKKRWVDQISKNINKEASIDVSQVAVCVFNVPKSISRFNPEAYVPQAIALGPYHHFETRLYQMERYKVAVVKAFLDPNQVNSFEQLVINKLKRVEPMIRACYHNIMEIDIPSVSSLSKYAHINFSPSNGGIRDTKFVATEAILYLPVITLEIYSEVVLRNLVSYEIATSSSTMELAQYVDLMSGIIDTEEDVKLLKSKGIVKGNMTNIEIVDLFNGMNKSSEHARGNETVKHLNEYYNTILAIKTWKFMKKRMRGSRKVLTVVFTLLACLLMIVYSFCEVYGCPKSNCRSPYPFAKLSPESFSLQSNNPNPSIANDSASRPFPRRHHRNCHLCLLHKRRHHLIRKKKLRRKGIEHRNLVQKLFLIYHGGRLITSHLWNQVKRVETHVALFRSLPLSRRVLVLVHASVVDGIVVGDGEGEGTAVRRRGQV
ncbi:hypothetical protein L1987_54195 [Smallanthus sonchifolius]|uniref:Uncharacterized protein n=1 Tax=Smallanthus sonchifolius TaxID=185202 RepID=A0ACB9E6G6_9ASTR|nr:hypothetical protein L1987_54195 [Smallanthus sonchifolius]